MDLLSLVEELFLPRGVEVYVCRVDLDATPLEVAATFQELDGFAFLDSSAPGEQGRFSVLAWEPPVVFRSKGEQVDLRVGAAHYRSVDDPFRILDRLLRAGEVQRNPEAPYAGGAVGYLGYDLFSLLERFGELRSRDDLALPDAHLAFHDTLLVHDCRSGAWSIVVTPVLRARHDALRLVDARATEISASRRALTARLAPQPGLAEATLATSNMTKSQYLAAVRAALEYVSAGEIYQVNLSQRFHTTLREPPFELFTRLRDINPSFYGAFLRCDDHVVISSSPELFLRREGETVETRPIKGTRRRGATRDDDARLERELLASAKDAAELAMIVDLERNDLGRVCAHGSVEVTEHRYVEPLPTVFHTISTVRGRLRDGVGAVDLLRATFPGGSITGCPKIRSMVIIDELEPTRRHVYTGAIGQLGFDGDLTLNIAIRSLVVRGDDVYFQVGSGIVADSVPEDEYQETLHKAAAILHALGAAALGSA